MTTEEKKRIIELVSEGMGYKGIATVTGISLSTVKSFLKRPGKQEYGVCPQCGAPLINTPGKKIKKYCSDECRLRWWNQHPELVTRREVHKNKCLNCGEVFSAGKHPKQLFCSRKCYADYRRRCN